MQNEWNKFGDADISLTICKDALVEQIKKLQAKYPQYDGLYDDNHGWKLATVLEPLDYKGASPAPGMLMLARAEIRNGHPVIHATTVVGSWLNDEPYVHAWIIPTEEMFKVYFLEK